MAGNKKPRRKMQKSPSQVQSATEAEIKAAKLVIEARRKLNLKKFYSEPHRFLKVQRAVEMLQLLGIMVDKVVCDVEEAAGSYFTGERAIFKQLVKDCDRVVECARKEIQSNYDCDKDLKNEIYVRFCQQSTVMLLNLYRTAEVFKAKGEEGALMLDTQMKLLCNDTLLAKNIAAAAETEIRIIKQFHSNEDDDWSDVVKIWEDYAEQYKK